MNFCQIIGCWNEYCPQLNIKKNCGIRKPFLATFWVILDDGLKLCFKLFE